MIRVWEITSGERRRRKLKEMETTSRENNTLPLLREGEKPIFGEKRTSIPEEYWGFIGRCQDVL